MMLSVYGPPYISLPVFLLLRGDMVSSAWWAIDSCAIQELLSLTLVELNVEQNQTGLLKGLYDFLDA